MTGVRLSRRRTSGRRTFGDEYSAVDEDIHFDFFFVAVPRFEGIQ